MCKECSTPPPPLPPKELSPPPKISEKGSSLDLWQFKIHQHLANFRELSHAMCYCLPPRKSEFEPFLVK